MAIDSDNPHKRVGVSRLVRAVWYSLEGVGSAIKHESAFRQELFLAALMVPLAVILPVGLVGSALMITSVLLVLIVELINSAIEWVVDYISFDLHPLAKRAKDMGSGAVLIALTNTGLIWTLVIVEHWSEISRQFAGLFG